MTEYTHFKTNIFFDIVFIILGSLVIFGSDYVMNTISESYRISIMDLLGAIMDLLGAGLLFAGILNLVSDLRSKPNKPEE